MQRPFAHTFEQHCPFAKHPNVPLLRHPHLFWLHCMVQHCVAPRHPCPSGRHGAVHVPFAQSLEQQPLFPLQLCPAAPQPGDAQKPLLHSPPQHCCAAKQPRPLAVHAAPHVPFSQAIEQHSPACVHPWPLGVHAAPTTHFPPVHWPEQHC